MEQPNLIKLASPNLLPISATGKKKSSFTWELFKHEVPILLTFPQASCLPVGMYVLKFLPHYWYPWFWISKDLVSQLYFSWSLHKFLPQKFIYLNNKKKSSQCFCACEVSKGRDPNPLEAKLAQSHSGYYSSCIDRRPKRKRKSKYSKIFGFPYTAPLPKCN